MGSALRKRLRPYQAGAPGQDARDAPAAVLQAAPGAAVRVTALRRNESSWLIPVAAAGLLAGAGVAWIISESGPDRLGVPDLPLAVPIAVLVGWSFIGSGLLYWRSRPDNHLWAVLVFQGFAWFASLLPFSDNPVLFHLRGSGLPGPVRQWSLPGPLVSLGPAAGHT